jgi:hypothetical protein
VNGVPIADECDSEDQECDQQQARRLSGIDRMPLMLAGRRMVWTPYGGHAYIVAPGTPTPFSNTAACPILGNNLLDSPTRFWYIFINEVA